MRAISTGQGIVLASGARASHLRVQIKDAGGTFRDLTTYPGVNLVNSATWRDGIDANGQTAEVLLQREQELVSLAPYMQASPLNVAWTPGGSYAALLALGREIKIEWALVPMDAAPEAGDWTLGFHGYVDRIDWGPPEIRVECRDLSAKLQDTWMERERVYAFAQGAGATKGCFVWQPSRAYALNELVVPTDSQKGIGKYYKVTTAGTSGATEPTWPSTGTVASGGVVFTKEGDTSTSAGTPVETVMQQIIDDHLGAGVVTLNVPVPTTWAIRAYQQQRESVWQAIRALADQMGWDLRYLYDAGTSSFKLKLTEPNRAKVTPDRTFAAGDYEEVTQLTLDIAQIRNRVRVSYDDSQDKDPAGNPKRKSVTVEDATSQAKYGVRAMEVSEDWRSNIDSAGEATAFATAMLSDLKEPNAEQNLAMLFFPFVELGDLYRVSPNGRHSSTDLDVAVVSYSHDLSGGTHRTTVQCRGKPSAGTDRWLKLEVGDMLGDPHLDTQSSFFDGLILTATPAVGGARLQVSGGEAKGSIYDDYEVHVAQSAGFAPSAGTLIGRGRGSSYAIEDQAAGEIYYAKIVPRGKNDGKLVRGQPTAEISYVAGRAKPIHLDPETVAGPLPPNGSFEGRFRGAASPPDLWAMVTGAWQTDADWEASTVYDGTYAVLLKSTSVAARLRTEFFPVRPGWGYAVSFSHRNQTAIDTAKYLDVAIEWYTAAKSLISTSVISINLNGLGTTSWFVASRQLSAPATATFAKLYAGKQTADAFGVYVDAVAVLASEGWTALSYGTNWASYGAPYPAASYYLTPDGIVLVRGGVANASGGLSTVIGTLPVGYRPASDQAFATPSQWSGPGHVVTRVEVDYLGQIVPTRAYGAGAAGNCTYLSLDLSFRAGV